jgi:drug/metabolite transporter (DMT)-like permease
LNTRSSPDRTAITIFFLTALLGGGNSAAIRFSNAELAPYWGAGIRFAGSSLLFWLILCLLRIELPDPRASIVLLFTGFFAVGISFALLYYGLVELHASLGAVIISLGPLMTFFLAIAHRMEKFRWLSLLGGVIALVGIAIAVRAQVRGDVPIWSVMALVTGAAIAAEGNIVMKIYSPKSDPLATNALTMSAGMVFLLVLSFVAGERHAVPALPATWIAIVYAVIPGSVITFYMFIWLLGRWSASATHYVVMLFPIVATIAGSLLAGEKITFTFVIGGALVLFGVWTGALMKA